MADKVRVLSVEWRSSEERPWVHQFNVNPGDWRYLELELRYWPKRGGFYRVTETFIEAPDDKEEVDEESG